MNQIHWEGEGILGSRNGKSNSREMRGRKSKLLPQIRDESQGGEAGVVKKVSWASLGELRFHPEGHGEPWKP